jgi:transcriptional/translational regulatory protein YebC/TACO1
MDIALDAGAEDLVDEGDYFEVITPHNDLSNINDILKSKDIEISNAEATLRADTLIEVDQEMAEKILKIMDFMDDLDDVQEVHTNAQFPDNFEPGE